MPHQFCQQSCVETSVKWLPSFIPVTFEGLLLIDALDNYLVDYPLIWPVSSLAWGAEQTQPATPHHVCEMPAGELACHLAGEPGRDW